MDLGDYATSTHSDIRVSIGLGVLTESQGPRDGFQVPSYLMSLPGFICLSLWRSNVDDFRLR